MTKSAIKLGLAVVIVAMIGRQFHRDLTREDFANLSMRPGWLIASAALYLGGMMFSGLFWFRLMRWFNQPVTLTAALTGYFVGHLGKYVPGKAWALWLRGEMVRGPGVSMGVCIVTAFYEVLTTMAAGALVAAVVFAVHPPQFRGLVFPPYLTGLLLLAACGVPLLPGVFNFLAERLARRVPGLTAFRNQAPSPPGTPGGESWGEGGSSPSRELMTSQGISPPSPPTPLPRSTGGEGSSQVPKLRFFILIQGLLLTAVGWSLMGLSLWAGHAAIADAIPELTFASWADYCADIAMAYVLGFVVFTNPGGIGVREWVLRELLTADKPATIVVVVLMLRIVWTATELVVAGLLFLCVRRGGEGRASKLARLP